MLRALLIALAAAAATTAALWLITRPDLAKERRRAAELEAELAPLTSADEQATAFHQARQELEFQIVVISELRRQQDDLAATWASIDPLVADAPIAFLTLTSDSAEMSLGGDLQTALDLAARLEQLPDLSEVEVVAQAQPGQPPLHTMVAQRARRLASDPQEVDSL